MIYQYDCSICGKFEVISRISEHKNIAECPNCGMMSRQVIFPPALKIPKDINYISPTTGRTITSERARINDLAESNCMPYEVGMRQDVDRRVIEDEKRLDKDIERTVEKAIDNLPSDKLSRLGNELTSGLTADVIRL
jgi:putative FmdB family regulatory protein